MRYYNDKDGRIYRQLKSEPDKAVVCTPNPDEDRRVLPINDKSLGEINKHIAKQEINRQWDAYKDEWTFEGKKYRTKDTLVDIGDLHCVERGGYKKWEFDGNYGKHIFHGTYKFKDHVKEYTDTYWLGQFQGKLIWYTPYHYCPSAYAFNFESIDKQPTGFGIGYIPMRHIKPVYCVTDKKYI